MSAADETRVDSQPRQRLWRRVILPRRLPAAAWVAVGLVGAAIIAPASAIAASNLVGIVGANGTRAYITAAGQVQATEATPVNFVALYAGFTSACNHFYTVPKGKGLIIESVTFNNLTVTSPGDGTYTGLYANATCFPRYFLDENPGGTGEVSVPLTPGVALKAGTSISLYESGLDTEVYVFGYLVPANDVPANRLPGAPGRVAGPAQR